MVFWFLDKIVFWYLVGIVKCFLLFKFSEFVFLNIISFKIGYKLLMIIFDLIWFIKNYFLL